MSKYFDTGNMDKKDKEFVDKLDGIVDIFNGWFMDYIKAKDYKNIEKMIKDGHNVEFEINSMSPLMLASFMNENYIIELLLNSGADINKGYIRENSTYTTPLKCSMYAIFCNNNTNKPTGNINTIKLLLEHGAKYNDIDLEHAKMNHEIYNLFSQYQGNYLNNNNNYDDILSDTFISDIIANNISYSNLSDNLKECVNKTFISYIGKDNKVGKLQALINFGINLDFVYDSYTPLVKAIIFNDVNTIELLIKGQANINKSFMVDDRYFTALKTALLNYQNYKKTDIIELLLQHGSNYDDIDLVYINRFELQKLFAKYINNATEQAKLSPLFNKLSYYNSSVYKEAEAGFNDFINKIESDRKENETKKNNDNGACYIATAVYGDYNCPEVKVLRNFRDNYLLKYKVGKAFVNYYYKYSPNLVRKLKKYNTINRLVKRILSKVIRLLRYFKY